MERVKQNRSTRRRHVTKLVNEIATAINSERPDRMLLDSFLERLRVSHEQLCSLNKEYEEYLDGDDLQTELDSALDYEDKAITAMANLRTRILTLGGATASVQPVTTAPSTQQVSSSLPASTVTRSNGIRLPKLQLMRFRGDLASWGTFWEQFKGAIHDNVSLSTAEKFHYLRSLLDGSAASAIAGLQATEECYTDAIEVLIERFGDKTRIERDHLSKLRTLPRVKSSRDVHGLRKLYDHVQTHVRGLKALGVSSETYASMMSEILLASLPEDTVLDYQRQKKGPQLHEAASNADTPESPPSSEGAGEKSGEMKNILNFIRIEIEAMEGVRLHEKKEDRNGGRKGNVPEGARPPSSYVLYNDGKKGVDECVFCDSRRHSTVQCNSAMPISERKSRLAKDQRCFRCTKKGHRSRDCRSKITCGTCKGRHATALCDPDWRNSTKEKEGKETAETNLLSTTTVTAASDQEVMLQSFRAFAVNEEQCVYFRGILDGGSQRTFIREDLSTLLKLDVVDTIKLRLNTFANASQSVRKCDVVRVRVRSLYSPTETMLEAVAIPFICNDLSATVVNADIVRQLQLGGAYLADKAMIPKGAAINGISMLIGSDQMWSVLTGQVRRSKTDERLVAIESTFGWTLQGPTSTKVALHEDSTLIVSVLRVDSTETETCLAKFWDLEAIGITDVCKSTEQRHNEVMKKFTETIKQKDGRYVVSLPWKETPEHLDDNREVAVKRLTNLTRRLFRDDVVDAYDSAIRTYLTDEHAEKVPPESDTQHPVYYMPHRGVVRETSTTTRLRIVFDASSHAQGQTSLNEHLEKGPKMNCDLLPVLLRFRTYPIALSADIRKAFLQIEIDEKDRDALRFLWFEHKPEDGKPLPKIEEWRMTRVPFGTTASPFLLSATIGHHLSTASQDDQDIAEKLRTSFYVDDLLTGADNDCEAINVYEAATRLLKEAGMELQKWASNSPVLEDLLKRENDDSNQLKSLLNDPNMTKVLGLTWNQSDDSLKFSGCNVLEVVATSANTKRAVLKACARLFDPLGLLAPYTIRTKIIFQKLWEDGLSWDSPIPESASQEWSKWCNELLRLDQVSVNRYAMHGMESAPKKLELHAFTDASPLAYGACIYLRAVDNDGNTCVSLLLSKARVAPLKKLSLPRLELLAAVIGARLAKFTEDALPKLEFETTFWCDSTIALTWLKSQPTRWKPFVANRVKEIQALTNPARWYHCPGTMNPADLLTRGIAIENLLRNDLWWRGPEWLASAEFVPEASQESTTTTEADCEATEEETRRNTSIAVHLAPVTTVPLLEVERFSSLQRLLRVTAWVRRFLSNCRKLTGERNRGALDTSELQEAEYYWILQAQRDAYREELDRLTDPDKTINPTSPTSLRLRLDEQGLLRLEGRLHFADEREEAKHPILLPKDHYLTKLVVSAAHQRTLHGGVQDTLSEIREAFWIPQARQLVKRLLRQCTVCKKARLKATQAPTAPLPEDRVRRADPFDIVGIDFAGPLLVKTNDGVTKAYIALFTCAVTRAVHLELAPNMTTKSFLMALRRFISRRGIPSTIYSDNAKTFHRASKELRAVWEAVRSPEIIDFCTTQRVTWKFIVELAPWWGGFWERLVKTVKTCLKKILGRQSLTFEEMSTTLAEVEGVVNSRPITFVQSCPDEPQALSPAHFLIGRRISALPKSQAELTPSSRMELTRRWRHRQLIMDRFWDRWRKEYLLQLRSAHHGSSATDVLQVNDLVIVDDHKSPRHLWKVARVLQTYPGRDGHIRACSVRLPSGAVLRRAVQHLYPLECGDH